VRVPTMNLSAEERDSLHAGSTLHFTFEGKVMHFFDVESEVNLLVDEPAAPTESDESANPDESAESTETAEPAETAEPTEPTAE
ncbi:MAG: hypothetical protein ACI3XE_00865, partial [Eubacteriales bacterium]